MMTADTIEFNLVDAFTLSGYSGNVAGVVFDADDLTDRQMQAIASELNASVTAFILRPTLAGAAVRLRWFTPECEIGFCGHATFGAVHVLLESERLGMPADRSLMIESKKGMLAIVVSRPEEAGRPGTIWLDMPNPQPKSRNVFIPFIAERLGLHVDSIDTTIPPIVTHDNDLIVAVKDLQTLLTFAPSMSQLAAYCRKDGLRGVLVTTRNVLSKAMVAQSRFFAPAIGIDEDTVSGSVHGPYGLHLVESGIVPLTNGRAEFCCAQGKAGGRAGLIDILVEKSEAAPPRVRIGGSCVTTVSGTLRSLPAR